MFLDFELEQYYDFEIPDHIVGAQKSSITVLVGDVITGKSEKLKIKASDVAEYYVNESGNILSGMRQIAGHYGDWRSIDYLAQEAIAWLIHINPELMRREVRRLGARPKF